MGVFEPLAPVLLLGEFDHLGGGVVHLQSGMMGSGAMAVILLLMLLVWLAGLAAVEALGFWAVKKLR